MTVTVAKFVGRGMILARMQILVGTSLWDFTCNLVSYKFFQLLAIALQGSLRNISVMLSARQHLGSLPLPIVVNLCSHKAVQFYPSVKIGP